MCFLINSLATQFTITVTDTCFSSGYGGGSKVVVKKVVRPSHSGLGFGGGGVGGYGGVGGGHGGGGLGGFGGKVHGVHGGGFGGAALHGSGSIHRGSSFGGHGAGGFGGSSHGGHSSGGYKKYSGCKCREILFFSVVVKLFKILFFFFH